MKTMIKSTPCRFFKKSGIAVFLVALVPVGFATINFTPPSLLPGTSLGEAVAIADLDNDGKNDIVVTTSGNGPDRIYRNLGGGNFELILLPGLSDGFGVAVGDLNGNGLQDIFVATAGTVDFFYRNDGAMNFTKIPLTLSTAGTGVALGQFTNSGRLDAVVSTNGGADIVYRNDGNLNFTAVQMIGSSFGLGVGVGDINGDGKLDFYVATSGSGDRVYRNTGTGNNIAFATVTSSTSTSGRGVAMGNFRPESGAVRMEAFVPAAPGSNSMDYYGRLATDSFLAISSTGVSMGTVQRNGVAAGDLNGDGTPDVFVAVGNGADFVYTTSIVPATGLPAFTREPWNGATSVGRAVALGDLDGDGDLDVVVATGGAGGGGAADLVYFNNLLTNDLPDTDNDGLPDEWEAFYGLNVNVADSHLDSDHDGVTNLQEYVTGSNPLDANDRGSLLQVVLSPAGPILQFYAKRAEGVGYIGRQRFYTLECATDLTEGDWITIPGFTEILGDNQTVQMPFVPDKVHFRTLIELR